MSVLKKRRRSFTWEFKLAALARLAKAENIVALAQELTIGARLLYDWRDQYTRGGAAALRRAGRPRAGELSIDDMDAPVEASVPDASRRIAALERKIGQQQFELDFFRAALKHVRVPRRSSGEPGGTASTR